MTVELEEIGPGRWRVKKVSQKIARSNLPLPYVISDIMDPVEQVDGRFYTSKREFRAVGKANGLIEVGNEKPKPRARLSQSRAASESRRASIRKAVEQVRAGNFNSK
jgi:hypothetical protein